MPVDPWSAEFEINVASVNKRGVLLETLELHHSQFLEGGVRTAVRAVNDVKQWDFTLEAGAPVGGGSVVTFFPIPFTWEHPASEEGRAPQCTVRVDNIAHEISKYLDAAEATYEPIVLIYRVYLSNKPTSVDYGPFTFFLREVAEDGSDVSGSATFATPQNLMFGRRRFDPSFAPTLAQGS